MFHPSTGTTGSVTETVLLNQSTFHSDNILESDGTFRKIIWDRYVVKVLKKHRRYMIYKINIYDYFFDFRMYYTLYFGTVSKIVHICFKKSTE